MSASVRAMAQALDDSVLETLSSKGLLRRATADVAAGRATIVSQGDTVAEVRVEGETVRVLADGPMAGGCSCPAPGICRHRLAALILLRDLAEGPLAASVATADGDTAASIAECGTAIEPVDWAAVVTQFTPAKLARFAGKIGWLKVMQSADAVKLAEVRSQGGSLQVRLGKQEPVVFLVSGGLDAALSKTHGRDRKVEIALAALAARHALGLETIFPTEDEDSTDASNETRADGRTLEATQEMLRRAFRAALAFAPAALEIEVRRLAVAGRVESMPRLASLLRRLAGSIGTLRRRDADADPEAVLELIAEIYALSVALAMPINDAAHAVLMGKTRQEYEPIGDLRLFGLGAKLWSAPSGSHGVTAYFHDPETGRSFTVSHARPDHTDASFVPRAAFHHMPVWGLAMSRACVNQIAIAGAQASASNRLSAAKAITALLTEWKPSAEGVANWNCTYADWSTLEQRLRRQLAGSLSSPPPVELPVLLKFTRYAPARFNELTQTLIWPIADRHGQWIGLTLPYEGVGRERIAALEQLTARERFWAVAATAGISEGGIDIQPYAVWGDEQRLLDFRLATPPRETDFASLFARLRIGIDRLQGGPAHFAEHRSHTDRLIDLGWELVLRRAEQGLGLSHDAYARDCRELGAQFAMSGLTALARPFEAAGAAEDVEESCLRAAWAVTTARRMRSRLAWMK